MLPLFAPTTTPRYSLAPTLGGHIPAALAFILIFPTYFYYQTLVNVEYISPMLGGYFTAGAAAASPLLVYGAWRHRLSLWSNNSFTVGLFVIFLALLGFCAFTGAQTGADEEITSSHFAYLFKFVVLFLVARLVDAQATWFRLVSTALLIAVITLVIWAGQDGRFLQAVVLHDLAELPFILDYQGLAYSFIVIAIYCLPQLRKEFRWLLYAASLVSLFLIGARSEFAGFLLLSFIIEFCHSRARPIVIGAVAFGVLALAGFYVTFQDAISDHRIFGLLKLSSDQSAQERAEMHAAALRTIEDSPVLGQYASYEPGQYAHNILSAWVDLGFMGFAALLLLQIVCIGNLLARFRRHSRDILFIQTLAVQLFTTLLLLLAKNYTYQMIPIAFGLYCRFQALRIWVPKPASQISTQQRSKASDLTLTANF